MTGGVFQDGRYGNFNFSNDDEHVISWMGNDLEILDCAGKEQIILHQAKEVIAAEFDCKNSCHYFFIDSDGLHKGSAGNDLWNIKINKKQSAIAQSPDGKQIATVSTDLNTIDIFDAHNESPLIQINNTLPEYFCTPHLKEENLGALHFFDNNTLLLTRCTPLWEREDNLFVPYDLRKSDKSICNI